MGKAAVLKFCRAKRFSLGEDGKALLFDSERGNIKNISFVVLNGPRRPFQRSQVAEMEKWKTMQVK